MMCCHSIASRASNRVFRLSRFVVSVTSAEPRASGQGRRGNGDRYSGGHDRGAVPLDGRADGEDERGLGGRAGVRVGVARLRQGQQAVSDRHLRQPGVALCVSFVSPLCLLCASFLCALVLRRISWRLCCPKDRQLVYIRSILMVYLVWYTSLLISFGLGEWVWWVGCLVFNVRNYGL